VYWLAKFVSGQCRFQYKFPWLDGRDNDRLRDVKINIPIKDLRFGKPSAGSGQ
jgi:hypothetical protein